MAKVSTEKLYNTFVKGLITEANPLTYPDNASLDEDNFVLERNGSRSRRLGVDFESGFALTATGVPQVSIEGSKQSFHPWVSPSGDTTVSIGVVRVYNKLWFMDMLKTSPSANLLNGGLALTIPGLSNSNIETTVINNSLLIVGEDLELPILLSYDKVTKLVSQATVTMEVRDVWGVTDGLRIDERPASISNTHKYNLRNQGWSTKVQSTCGSDAIDCTFTTNGSYPSNADIWTLGKIGDANSANFEKYSPASMIKNSIDNSLVPIGSYILNAFSRGASRISLSGLAGLSLDKENGKITTATTYSSRVFYSGITSSITASDAKSPNYSGYLFFSPVVSSNDKLGKCYQDADPTSPNISDIIATDGGTIQIPEATKIIKLVATKSSLLVFAENGVWEIFGDTGGFVATSFQLSKVSSIGISNPKAVVESNGTVVYFAKSGIYSLTQEAVSGRYQADNISLNTIQTLYNNLSDNAKNNARGFFDARENRIRWLYNDTAAYSTISYVNKYNRELILDMTLKGFYTTSVGSLATSSPYVADYVEVPGYAVSAFDEDVYVGSDSVLSNTDAVVMASSYPTTRSSQFSFLTLRTTSFTLSKYISRTFKDWYTSDATGVNYSSYLVTGYEIFGDVMREKQVPYIFFYFSRTEDGFTDVSGVLTIDNPSSCLVQAQWNWTNSATSGKWGRQFQAYRFNREYIPTGPADAFDYSEIVIVTKNKLRGSGKSLSLKIQSEMGKDMKLLGWAHLITGDGKP